MSGALKTLSLVSMAEAEIQRSSHLSLVLEASAPWRGAARVRLAGFTAVEIGRGAQRRFIVDEDGRGRALRITVADPWMSTPHVRLEHRDRCWWVVDLGSKNRTRLDGAPVAAAPVRDGQVIEAGSTFFEFRADNEASDAEVVESDRLAPLLGTISTLEPSFAHKLRAADRIARAGIPVMLRGETGTGKEMVARAVHDASGRAGPFVALNCGALPRNLIESELFGYRKGAFSGADEDRPGAIRTSSTGTLFLDEIGDLPIGSQPALLRALQEAEVTPIGGVRPIKVDLRVVAATHQPVEAMIARGEFREDLYGRLHGLVLELPPLRERIVDLGVLIPRLLERVGRPVGGRGLSPAAARALIHYRWPRNIRELEQCLAVAVALAGAATIELDHLPASLGSRPSQPVAEPESGPSGGGRPAAIQLEALLVAHRGNLAAIARELGKAPMQVRRWLSYHGLDPDRYRRPAGVGFEARTGPDAGVGLG